MTRKTRAERREKRALERAEPPIVELPELTDPLRTFSHHGIEMTNHPLRGLWKSAPAGFLVCGGPRLYDLDLSRLCERGV